MKINFTSKLLKLMNFRKLLEVFYPKLIEVALKVYDLLIKKGCKKYINTAFIGRRKLFEVFYPKLIEVTLKVYDLLIKRGCKKCINTAFKGSRGLFEIFFPKAIGIAIKGNDLFVTRVCKRAFNTVEETVKVTDFLSKDLSELQFCIDTFKRSLNEVVLSIPREKALVREVDFPGSDLMEFKEALKYQLDSFIPFTEDDVYYDVYKAGDNEQNGEILIIAVKKNDLDEVMAKLETIGVIPTKVIISPIAFIPIVGEKKGKVVTIHKLTNNYCYNTFSNGLFVSTLMINEKDEILGKISYDMPDEILGDDRSVMPERDTIGVVNDVDTDIQEDVNSEITSSKSIQISEIDDNQESFGAALCGIQEAGQKFSLLSAGKRVIHLQKILMYGFIGMLFLFMILIPHVSIKRKLEVLDFIDNKIALLKDDMPRIEDIRNRLTVMEETLKSIGKVQAEYAPRIKILLELSEKLPKNAWIKELYIYRKTFEIGGTARSATDLIPTLENSALFSNVGLTAPVVNTAEGQESFRLKGEVNIENIKSPLTPL